jgi:peptidoglycan hydrolase CwlO-like protein
LVVVDSEFIIAMIAVAGASAGAVKFFSKKSDVNPEQLKEQQQQIQQLQLQVQQLQNAAGSATQSLQRYDDSYERLRVENEDLKGTISRHEQTIIRNEEAIRILRELLNESMAGKVVKEGQAK